MRKMQLHDREAWSAGLLSSVTISEQCSSSQVAPPVSGDCVVEVLMLQGKDKTWQVKLTKVFTAKLSCSMCSGSSKVACAVLACSGPDDGEDLP